jgi:hypothetical protein
MATVHALRFAVSLCVLPARNAGEWQKRFSGHLKGLIEHDLIGGWGKVGLRITDDLWQISRRQRNTRCLFVIWRLFIK